MGRFPIGTEKLSRADDLVQQRLARRAGGKQISFSFDRSSEDETFLERVAFAFELAAIEGLDELGRPARHNQQLRDQAVAALFRVFDIRRLLPVPAGSYERPFFVLQLSAAAYCGDRWLDLRHWYREQGEALRVPSVADAEWDRRLLYGLFACWIRLFRKESWDDLDRIRGIIAGLRHDQHVYEEHLLQNGSGVVDRTVALRLAALYYWAKATETLARYMLRGEPGDPFSTLNKHFEAGIRAAAGAGDRQQEMVLRWLHATARVMVTNSMTWATRTVNS